MGFGFEDYQWVEDYSSIPHNATSDLPPERGRKLTTFTPNDPKM